MKKETLFAAAKTKEENINLKKIIILFLFVKKPDGDDFNRAGAVAWELGLYRLYRSSCAGVMGRTIQV